MSIEKEAFSKILRESGFKATPTRLAVLEIFSKTEKPVDADFIFNKLKSKKIDRATIHRTLNSFKSKKIIKRVDLRKKSAFFELAEKHKHYIVCVRCGMMENFNLCVIGKISKDDLKKSKNFKQINDHSLELFGVCRTCTTKA
jgi:Fur family transcriptional regulator, ferric uptake regulator